MISLSSSTDLSPVANLHEDLHRRGVLLVDDSSMHRYSAELCLRAFGIENIVEAANGKLALEYFTVSEHFTASEQPPVVVVLDLEMPVMDGIEVLQQLATLSQKPAVILASSSDEVLISAVATMAEALGITLLGAFRKPLNPADLAAALSRYAAPLDTPDPQAKAQSSLPEVDITQLKQALERASIQVFYQPKIDLASMKIAGVEALARWRNSQGDWIPPSLFIPLAEKHGLIGDLTLSLLDQILQDMNGWWSQGVYIPVAMNLSATSLAEFDLANAIIHRVIREGIPARFISFEITESALVVDLPSALATISRLRLKGFGISIDDYGTGFSSMQQLARFPFSELKIDRSFVHGAPERQYLRTILKSAIDMGIRLGITTVAEGVESEAELHLLKSLGCNQAQGFLLARPFPGRELLGWIERAAQSQTPYAKHLFPGT